MEENLDKNNEVNNEINKETSDNPTKSNSEEIKGNESEKVINKDINIKVMNNKTKFTSKYKINQILKINIAHNEGNYFTNSKHLAEIKKEQKGWLDITYLSEELRICRGDKGTLFVLKKRSDEKLFKRFQGFIDKISSKKELV